MHKSLNYIKPLVISFLAAVVMIGCSAGTPEAAATSNGASTSAPADPTQTASPTISVEPPLTGTPIPTRTFSLPTSSPPSDNGKILYLDRLILRDSLVPSCNLPCWRGLIAGQSNIDDVQYVFDNSFGVNGEHNVGLTALQLDRTNNTPSIRQYLWGTNKIGNFSVGAKTNPGTNSLEWLIFNWGSQDTSKFKVNLSPSLVIENLGKPDFMLANADLQGGPESSIIDMMLIYDKGMFFYFSNQIVPTEITYADAAHQSISEIYVQYCLDDITVPSGANVLGSVYVLDPFKNGLDNLSPVQQKLVLTLIENRRLKPIEDIFAVTGEDITQLNMTDNHVCLQRKLQ